MSKKSLQGVRDLQDGSRETDEKAPVVHVEMGALMEQLEVMVSQLRFEGEAHTTSAGWDEERDCARTIQASIQAERFAIH